MSFLKRYFSKTMEKNQSMPNTEKDVPAMIPSDSNVDLLPQKEPQETLVVAKSEHLESPVQPPVPKEETKTEEQQKKPAIIILLTIRKINKELPDSYCIKKVRERIRAFRIPFPTVGVPFQCSFDFSKIEGIALTGEKEIEAHKPELHFQALPPDMGLSLHCDDHILTLSGTPKKEYDGKLYFVYQTEEQKSILRCLKLEGKKYEGYHNYQESIPFLIAGDPRNAWQDYDVDWDKEGCYKNEDKCSEGKLLSTSCGDIEVIAASVRGRSHANVAKPRDDAFHFDFDKETGWNFVAVADGLGSKKYSRKGSELACKTIVEALRKLLTTKYNAECLNEEGESLRRWKEHAANPDSEDIKASQLDAVFHNAVHSAWMAINNEAENKGAKIDDYSTTLLCAAFRYLKELKIWLIVSYWIGDGGAAIIKSSVANSSEDGIAVLGKPDGGEFAGQVKSFTAKDEITAEAIYKRLRFSFCDSFEAIILVTDGITDPFFPSDDAVADGKHWSNFYANILPNGCKDPESIPVKELHDVAKTPQEKADAFINWLGFWSKGNHDDRTILIVKPR